MYKKNMHSYANAKTMAKPARTELYNKLLDILKYLGQ